MSLLSVVPEAVTAASGSLENLGSALRSVSAAAAGQTTAIAPPGADEISSAIAGIFGSHGADFQALNARGLAFHAEFAKLLNGGALQYASTEIANAQ